MGNFVTYSIGGVNVMGNEENIAVEGTEAEVKAESVVPETPFFLGIIL